MEPKALNKYLKLMWFISSLVAAVERELHKEVSVLCNYFHFLPHSTCYEYSGYEN